MGSGLFGGRIGWGIPFGVALSLGPGLARGDFHTVTFSNPPGVPTGHLPDNDGILVPTSQSFQEDGVHVEAIWAPSTHVGFAQGHFHHLENGYETSHGFGDADAEGWHDLQGFYIQMTDGAPFSLRSIDFRLRVDLQTTRILVTTDLDPTQPFTGQFVEFPVGRFSTFKTLNIAGFEDVTQVFISSVLVDNNTEQIQLDNLVVWTAPPILGACCPSEGISCELLTVEDCTSEGGTYLGDKSVCTNGGFCPTRTGACCSPDAFACAVKEPAECVLPNGVFSGLGTECGIEAPCPATAGACCMDNGAACAEVLRPICTGADTFFRGEGTQCVVGGDCPVPCDADLDCDDGDVCNGSETCDLGTGECNPGTTLDCDDQDACTIDACDSVTGCLGNPRDCDDSDPCTVDTCDAGSGCQNDAIVCDDGDVCDGVAACNSETGACEAGIPPDCDDADACTIDHCDPVMGCLHSPRSCDDGDPCTTDTCDPQSGCGSISVACEDGDVCNGVATCNPETGECQSGTALDCDDADPCTLDDCDPQTGCAHSPRVCDDGDPCTVDTCDVLEGCENTPIACDDGNVCNGLDTCNPETGACQPGTLLDCDDADACTLDDCDPLAGCLHDVSDCDDDDLCTVDTCETTEGCKNTPIVCEDGDACNGVATCDAETGECRPGTPLDCDDADACTVDACDPQTACFHGPRGCDDGNPCTDDSCDVLAGCRNVPISCDDENVCNGVATCDPETGECQAGTLLDCDDADACTLDDCDPLTGCSHSPRGCDDGDPCTVDTCDVLAGCRNIPISCDDGNVCNGLDTCNPETGKCQAGTLLDCDDASACTLDDCDPLAGCLHEARDCDDGDPCTVDTCEAAEGCKNVPMVCEDGDVCNGLATCDAETGECRPGTPLDCDDADACTVDGCEPAKGCSHNPRSCDDHDACTQESCDPLKGCSSGPICPPGYACFEGECSCIEPPGDYDGDGHRGAADSTHEFDCLRGPDGGVPSDCECADFDADGDIDLLDLADYLNGVDIP